MAIGKIKKEFKAKLRETANAVLFKDFDNKEYWIPKNILTLVKEKNGMIITTLAAFKFEEITGIHPEDMKISFLSMGGYPLLQHKVDCNLVESERYPLMQRQREQLQIMVKCRHNFINWEAGAGKTLASLTLANSYFAANLIDFVVILCPASLQGQWEERVKEYFPNLTEKCKILSIEANSFTSSLKKMLEKYNAICGRKHLILDESHLIKNISANRTKNIDRFYKNDFATCCTASAIGINASDLFYQYSIADRDIVGCENYTSFAKKFLLFGGQDGDRVVAYQNTKDLSKRISPYTFFLKRDEIVSMPKKHYHKVYFDMEDRQRQAYTAINHLIFEIQSKTKNGYIPKEKTYQITSFLQKISCGFIPTDEELKTIFSNLGTLGEAADNVSKIKNIAFVESNARFEEIKKITNNIGQEQVIIWCSYRSELNALSRQYPNSRQFIGGMTVNSIQKTLKEFKANSFQYLIAMQQMGTGFDLPFLNHAIYSTTVFDYIKRAQSEDRIYRINRIGDCHIYDLIAKNSIDERIKNVLEYKKEITEIFNGQNDSNSSC